MSSSSQVSGGQLASPTIVTDALRAAVRGEVDDATVRRSEYSSDASNYRVEPAVVVFPLDADDIVAAVAVARELGVPLTVRGAGTSVAGNAIGVGIVLDTSVHMNRVLEVDPDRRIARVQPGAVLSDIQKAAARFGLRFGPDPSTQSRATIGGMIGNNACGPHALSYGRTSDNVVELEVVDGLGRRYRAGQGVGDVPGLAELIDAHLAPIRTGLGRFGRQVSGYSLEHLLPERGRNLAKALVGTEGTVVMVLEATIMLVPLSPSPALVLLGYPSMIEAAADVPRLLPHKPLAMEGLDADLVAVVRRHRAGSVPELPEGGGWLFVEVGGDTPEEAWASAESLVNAAAANSSRIVPAGPEATVLWQLRADGAGLAGRTGRGEQAWPGWEDAAVPPDELGAYLRDFTALMAEYSVSGLAYGHFGDGCVHVRIDFPLEHDGDVLRSFVERAAEIVIARGGSLSGEHGDGRARSELLTRMYDPEIVALFGAFKALLDPEGLFNPGVIVDPRPIDADLRRPKALPIRAAGGFAFGEDQGDFTKAVHRCVGVGKCRADNSGAGGFMCPSYQATKDETDVTRGRARVLQDLTNGRFGPHGWDAQEVESALDLCLSCKACSSDCPAGVDMARYKSESLFRRYRGRIRPANHYVLGWLPRWARLASLAPGLANFALHLPGVDKIVLRAGGMDSRRSIPRFASRPFHRRSRSHVRGTGRTVMLWVDSFGDAFSPGIPEAAIRVLEDAGYRVVLPERSACCGLTWISTGQLTGAKRRLNDLLDVLGPAAAAGIPIVGLEPSCTAVLRSDLTDLLPDDPRSHAVAEATVTVAELLSSVGWQPPDLSDLDLVVQPHCHQHSVMGFEADLSLLSRAGARVTTIAGCCGLAGNFGMESGHYEVSVAVAENGMLPALRNAADGAVLVADGFSCRTQADQLAGATGVALVELLAGRLAR